MRKKIQNLAYARFQYEKPNPEFSVEQLEIELQQEENYKGSFHMTSTNGIAIRGMVYSTSGRMECLTQEFEGTDITVAFEFHSEGLIEGDVQKGEFTIICNGGEYSLPFVVTISRFYTMSSMGKIKNLFDFANLAQKSYEEAFRIFRAPCFMNLIKETEIAEQLLYRAVGGRNANLQGMEEFLIGIRKKQRIRFTIEESDKEFCDVTEDTSGIIWIKKEQWGYAELNISSDNEAVMPVKSRITSEDFIGNFAEIAFVVKADKLHGGNNYAKFTIESLNQKETCEISVRKKWEQELEEREERIKGREKKQQLLRLTKLYLDFRMKRIVTGVWTQESCACLEWLKELEPDNLWYDLYRAQTLLVNKQRQEAEWILDEFRREPIEKDSTLYAYYLYLTTLQEKEPFYVAKVWNQVQEIYRRNQEDMKMFLLVLFLDPQLNQSKSRKLAAIEEKVAQGMQSPLLYMEAYYLLQNDVYLLLKLGDFERKVLYWAAKEGELTPAVSAQICQYSSRIRQYHRMWYEILKACYQVNGEKEMLQILCGFCVKWNLFSEKHFYWYDMGIQEEFRLAGLYEAWLESAGLKQIEKFPKAVMLYFQYQSNLNYKKQAMLYASIIRNKSSQWSLYEAYEKHIEHFAIEQLLCRRIDENLAVLYEELLNNQSVNGEIADALAEVLYTHKLVCGDSHAVKAVVVHYELEGEQITPIIKQQAYIQLYSEANCILLENERGIRYIPADMQELIPLMLKERHVKSCIGVKDSSLTHLIHYFEGRKTAHTFQTEDLPRLLYMMESKEIRQEYKNEIKPQIIEYYYHSYTGEALDAYLKQVDYEGLKQNPRNKLMELMIARGIYDKAYEMLMAFGCERATASKLLLVVGNKISRLDYQADENVIGLCHTIFNRGKYNETILKYLCKYFHGNVKEMERLWKAAKEFELDTYELEERFLVQLLYTEGYTKGMEDIFRSYFDARGQEMIILAYLSYFSYQYFVKNMLVSDKLFGCIEGQLLLKNPLNDSCKLAYLKWLTERRSLTPQQEACMEELLSEYLKRKMYFAFYQELPEQLLIKYHLYDRIFLEYRTNPATVVRISYCVDGENYLEENMVQMYEGIFVKVFVAFFGEGIPYYMKEETPEGEVITESGHISTHDVMSPADESSYDMINDIMISYHMKDEETLRKLYGHYRRLENEVEQAFGLL